jgi:hypothetical protein
MFCCAASSAKFSLLSLSLLFKDEEGIFRKKKEEALVYQSGKHKQMENERGRQAKPHLLSPL